VGVNATAWCFGPEDFFAKRTYTGLFKSFEKFEIAPLEAELQLSKLQLKTEYHTSLNR
jgi:hypothetical protein